MSKINFTKSAIEGLPLPSKGWQYHRDLKTPALAIEPFKEVERDRFLDEDEIPRFFEALEAETEQNRDYFLLSLLTGARKSNVLSMRWVDINFNTGCWRVPGSISKNGIPMIIPITEAPMEILVRRKKSTDSEFVFPGAGVTGHMTSPKGAWKRVVARAGIQDIRPHDLRRSLGSWMVNTGASIAIIGGALGHKDSASTRIYARLATATIKGSMEIASGALMEAGRSRQVAETKDDK